MTTSDIQTWRYRVKINGTWEGDAMKLEIDDLRSALQSQAERIAELERESETYAKAYGLAIVERDNLRHELKTAQEGWRCECSTDDACRFARERDALRAELAEIAADEPVMFAYEYSDGSWHDASSTEHSAGMKPLFTRPMPAESKDAERYRWLRDYLISPSTHFDDLIVSADKAETLNGVIDAARAKGAKQ